MYFKDWRKIASLPEGREPEYRIMNIEVGEGVSKEKDLKRGLCQETLWLSQLGRGAATKHLVSSEKTFYECLTGHRTNPQTLTCKS